MRRPSCLSRKPSSAATNACALLDLREVPALRDDRDARARDQALVGEGVVLRKQPVVGAPDQQRRHVDPVQPFVQMRIVAARLPDQLGGGGPVLEVDVLELRRLSRSLIMSSASFGSWNRSRMRCSSLTQESIDLRHARARGCRPRRPASARRAAACCAPQARPRSSRRARWPTRSTLVQIELVEEVEIEVGEVGNVVEPVRRVGGAEARMLGHDHVVARGEVRHEGQPVRRRRSRRAGTAAAGPRRRASGAMLQPRTASVVVV